MTLVPYRQCVRRYFPKAQCFAEIKDDVWFYDGQYFGDYTVIYYIYASDMTVLGQSRFSEKDAWRCAKTEVEIYIQREALKKLEA